ncbi:MAG: Wzz/FepE/Etk N-terminal domain-containing protein [Clostridiales bacterium]|jgi:capsular polysaccharide biosynthesis protein|nr:Wzz/FepE/Etk N-terminal domain-containing protein [Clostridiales bacterium]MCI1962421.1 Wzz/FepE/Etk N-terminal domain-containing protein [Clostridiales bacterium]MCI2022689.1 Wzz/FepE/Etk N-terminal domain-containing protein [Clostridiales bacterium]MCI2026996.1 Wzz/FepE/Etk N-terminal domain-containing protein [Clostridiales bacterium]
MEDQISLNEIFFAIRKQWKKILLATIVGALVAFLISSFLIPKKYTSSIELYVNNGTNTSTTNAINPNDLTASQKLVGTYIVILKNRDVLSQVAAKIGNISYEQLQSDISMSAVDNTEVLKISAEAENPQLSVNICKAMADTAPDILKRVVKSGSVEVIGSASVPTEPSSPNIKRNTLIGALAFLIVSIFISIMMFMKDNTVKGEKDIQEKLKVPVLGEIPDLNADNKGGYRYG